MFYLRAAAPAPPRLITTAPRKWFTPPLLLWRGLNAPPLSVFSKGAPQTSLDECNKTHLLPPIPGITQIHSHSLQPPRIKAGHAEWWMLRPLMETPPGIYPSPLSSLSPLNGAKVAQSPHNGPVGGGHFHAGVIKLGPWNRRSGEEVSARRPTGGRRAKAERTLQWWIGHRYSQAQTLLAFTHTKKNKLFPLRCI